MFTMMLATTLYLQCVKLSLTLHFNSGLFLNSNCSRLRLVHQVSHALPTWSGRVLICFGKHVCLYAAVLLCREVSCYVVMMMELFTCIVLLCHMEDLLLTLMVW